MKLNTNRFLGRQALSLTPNGAKGPNAGAVTACRTRATETVELGDVTKPEPVSMTKEFLKFGLAGTLLGAVVSSVAVASAAAGTVACAPLVIVGGALAVGVTTGALGASEMTERAAKSDRGKKAPLGGTPLSNLESTELSTWMKPVAVLSTPASRGPALTPAWQDA